MRKTDVIGFLVGTIVDRQFSTASSFELTSGQWTRNSTRLGVRFSTGVITVFSATLTHVPCGLIEYHFSSDPSSRNNHCPVQNLVANKETS